MMHRLYVALKALVLALGFVGCSAVATASAQAYPSRPITVIVPYPAGGPSDTIGRIMAERMRTLLGQPVIIENVAGASGSIGIRRLAHATNDGYTLGIGTWPTMVLNGAVLPLAYDVLSDFEPIAQVASEPYLIVARRDFPGNDLKNAIAWLKQNPGKASWATLGLGSGQHVAGLLFQQRTGTRFQFVPYRGVGPALQDLIAGRIDILVGPATACLPHVHAGAVKAFAIAQKTRWAAAPEIPMVDEAGLPGFYFPIWNAFFAPRGTPAPILMKLNGAVAQILADPVIRARFAEIGQEIPAAAQQTADALAALQKAEIAKWWPIIKAEHITAQ